MNDLKTRPVKIMLDRERTLIMDMNALEELENIYEKEPPMYTTDKDGKEIEIEDPLTKALNSLGSKKRIKHIKNFLYAGLVYEDPTLTPQKIGSLISFPRLDEITDQIWIAVTQSLPDPKEGSEAEPGE
jgi:hypothetical protein